MKKKVLIHSIAFSPDGVSTAYLYNDIALRFKDSGYDVVVLTTTPHYNVVVEQLKEQPLKKQWLGLYYLSSFNGIKVIHVPQKKFKQAIFRILGFVYWHFLSLFLGLAQKNVSIILSPSPPLTIGFINLVIGKLKGAKVIYNVQEIYPDFLVNQGGLKAKPIIRILEWLERLVYNKSDAVTTIDTVFYQTIVDRFDDQSKLVIIPNFVDTELFRPLLRNEIKLNKDLFPDTDVLKVMYAGNIGHAQDWQPLLAAAEQVSNEKIAFWVIGEGAMKSQLNDEIAVRGLKNIHLVPYQSRQDMPALIAYADLHFIFMTPEMEGQGFPSKVYTIMACAKPLLVISSENTPIHNFLAPLDCAFLIDEKSQALKTAAVVAALMEAKNNPIKLNQMGRRGFDNIESKYSKKVVSAQYVALANQLLDA